MFFLLHVSIFNVCKVIFPFLLAKDVRRDH